MPDNTECRLYQEDTSLFHAYCCPCGSILRLTKHLIQAIDNIVYIIRKKVEVMKFEYQIKGLVKKKKTELD